jgi:hypothetical protein
MEMKTERYFALDGTEVEPVTPQTAALLDALVEDGHFDAWSDATAEDPGDLYDQLVDAGHDVELWADDPAMLRAYAQAVDFAIEPWNERGQQ